GAQNSTLFTVGIIVTGWYTRSSSDDDQVVTVSKPLDNFVTGGGYLIMSSSSSGGLFASAPGLKNNFGFNIKYNRNGTNLQGNINVIVRSGGRVYQIKGNSMTSLSTTVASGTATFNGKATIQDITDPSNPLAVEGNATLQVDMTDMGEPGSSDQIAITVWNKSGGLWFHTVMAIWSLDPGSPMSVMSTCRVALPSTASGFDGSVMSWMVAFPLNVAVPLATVVDREVIELPLI